MNAIRMAMWMAYKTLELNSSTGVLAATDSGLLFPIAISTLKSKSLVGGIDGVESDLSSSVAVSCAVDRFAEHSYPYF